MSEAAAIAALKEELSALRAEVAALRSASAHRDRSMRSNQACPACAGREIVHASEVLDRDQGRYPMAIRQPSVWRARVTGKFELYLCRTCGLVEWYANTADLEVDGEVLRLLDRAEGPAGGYR